jgi:hypothetical protein
MQLAALKRRRFAVLFEKGLRKMNQLSGFGGRLKTMLDFALKTRQI